MNSKMGPKEKLIETNNSLKTLHGRRKIIDEHLKELQNEFKGQAEINYIHASLICKIRRKVQPYENGKKFLKLWNSHNDFLCETLDLRWLLSACETFHDITESQKIKDLAKLISLLVNTVKLYETERFLSDSSHLKIKKTRQPTGLHIISEGITTFRLGGDALLNLSERLCQEIILSGESMSFNKLTSEIQKRLLTGDFVFARILKEANPRVNPINQLLTHLEKEKIFQKPQSWFLNSNKLAADQNKSYVLVNNTAALSGGFHAGTVAATMEVRKIFKGLDAKEAGWANTKEGIVELLTKIKYPDYIIINGEGSIHHDAPRMLEIIEYLQYLRDSFGIKIILLNSTIEGMNKEAISILNSFDFISVRDKNSKNELAKTDNKIVVASDLSIPVFCRFHENFDVDNLPKNQGQEFSILDSVKKEGNSALLNMAIEKKARFYTMPFNSRLSSMRSWIESNIEARNSINSIPKIFQLPDAYNSEKWITGRFHGMLILLACERKIACLESNTSKISSFLSDHEIAKECMLPSNWIDFQTEEKLEACTSLWISQETDVFKRKLKDTIKECMRSSEAITHKLGHYIMS